MLALHVEFTRFADLHVGDLFDLTAVYVIWDARAKTRPSYLGEGVVLNRFMYHGKSDGRRLARPFDGYIGTVDTRGLCNEKDAVRMTERLLLDVAFRTDRVPSLNTHPGHGALVREYCSEGIVRLSVHGYDPFAHPARGARMVGVRSVRAERDEDEVDGYYFDDDWRQRRRS